MGGFKWIVLVAIATLAVLTHAIAHPDGALDTEQCTYNNILLMGKVRVVERFADIKVRVVDSFPDLNVQQVAHFPDTCGKWQMVDTFPDFTIQYVDSFPDLEIRWVDSFPGIP